MYIRVRCSPRQVYYKKNGGKWGKRGIREAGGGLRREKEKDAPRHEAEELGRSFLPLLRTFPLYFFFSFIPPLLILSKTHRYFLLQFFGAAFSMHIDRRRQWRRWRQRRSTYKVTYHLRIVYGSWNHIYRSECNSRPRSRNLCNNSSKKMETFLVFRQ